jgi:AcrR family transcriptional regulator
LLRCEFAHATIEMLVSPFELLFSFFGRQTPSMVYRRTHQVVKRLAARRNAILSAARDAAAEGGMAAVKIAPVAARANVAAGTVYRYFPSKADLISELIVDVSRAELSAIRRACDAAPGPLSALAAAVTTIAVHVVSNHRLAWGILAEPVDVDVTASRLASRREIATELQGRIEAAVRAGHLPAQDTALAATALIGALHESLVGPLAPEGMDDPAKLRDAVQAIALFALRAVGVLDARARGLVVQAVVPALPARREIGALVG